MLRGLFEKLGVADSLQFGRSGSGAPIVGLLQPGNAGSNTATDHIEATKLALVQ